MTIVGHQNFWIVGSRFYFQPKIVTAGQEERLIDLGRIEVANPNIAPEVAQLEDSDGGVRSIVSEEVTRIDESYEIVTSNLNTDLMEMLFMSDPVAAFTQSATVKSVLHYARPNTLVKVIDDDSDGTFLYGIDRVCGLASGLVAGGVFSTDAFTAIVAATKTMTTAIDLTTHLSALDQVIIETTGLANNLNAGTYTVVSVSATEVVFAEDFAADEVAVTGSMVYVNATDSGTIYNKDTDWDVHHEERGIVSILAAGAITAGDLAIFFTPLAVSGNRLLNPQSGKSTIEGTGVVYWSRGNNTEVTVREFECSITPGGSGMSDTEYSSATLSVRVLNDLRKTTPAGRMINIKGPVSPTMADIT